MRNIVLAISKNLSIMCNTYNYAAFKELSRILYVYIYNSGWFEDRINMVEDVT